MGWPLMGIRCLTAQSRATSAGLGDLPPYYSPLPKLEAAPSDAWDFAEPFGEGCRSRDLGFRAFGEGPICRYYLRTLM